MSSSPSSSSDIIVTLSSSCDSLWRKCFALDHEMILTVAGRRVFPTLEYNITGLNPQKTYSMCFHLEQYDDKKLRYTNKCWVESTSSETIETPRKVWHLNGAQTGEEWMKRSVCFDQVRITNKKSKEQGNASYIHLHTQHRYMPVLSIYEMTPETGLGNLISTKIISHCLFITVTAYHNSEINTLKTNNNPYSTGSRKDRRRDRQSLSPTSCSSEDVSSEGSVTPPPAKRIKETSSPIVPQFSPAPAMPNVNPFMLQAFMLSQMYQMPMYPPFMFSNPSFALPTQQALKKEDEEDVDVV